MASLNLPDSNWSPAVNDRVQLVTAHNDDDLGTITDRADLYIEVTWDDEPESPIRYPDVRNLRRHMPR